MLLEKPYGLMNLIESIYSHFSNSLCQAENCNFKMQKLAGKKA